MPPSLNVFAKLSLPFLGVVDGSPLPVIMAVDVVK